MKIPLEYQTTDCDCCPATFINALKYLYDREEIPTTIIKSIYDYTLDRVNAWGTTRNATKRLVEYLNDYSKKHKFNMECKRYEGGKITTELIKDLLDENTIIILRLWSVYEHYVLVTSSDDKYLYLFDPYYDLAKEYENDDKIEVIIDGTSYNRKVSIERFDSENIKDDYALGIPNKRELITMRRI